MPRKAKAEAPAPERRGKFNERDRVAFSRDFLAGIGLAGKSGAWSQGVRGTVTNIESVGGVRFATVTWDGGRTSVPVIAANLVAESELKKAA